MTQNNILTQDYILQLTNQFENSIKLQENLKSQGWEDEAINQCIVEFKKLKSSQKLSSGLLFIIIGGAIGFISCVLCILNPLPEFHNLFLYGLTLISVLLIIYGMYVIFE
ncbi:MAG: hypothetical protein RLZZ175_1984 [Bacteroidota bacterium]|jgi:hypothetical protein